MSPQGNTPLFTPLVLQMITNALSSSLSARTHTVRIGEGLGKEESQKGGGEGR